MENERILVKLHMILLKTTLKIYTCCLQIMHFIAIKAQILHSNDQKSKMKN